MEILSNSRVFYILSNCNDGINWRRVYKSEERGSDSSYDPIDIEASLLCLGDFNKKIKIEFIDEKGNTLLDQGTLTVNDFIDNGLLELESGRKISATIEQFKLLEFIDYLNMGLEINLIVSIDFTASNDGCNNPNGLHYIGNNNINDYEKSIKQCGSVVAQYDYDQKFPLLGFGAMIPNHKSVSHCFPLNFNFDNYEVQGVNGMIETYKNNVKLLNFSGPTNFSPSIKYCVDFCKESMKTSNKNYFILMILTDGVISDMNETIDVIIEASRLPISIIIIGIGSADFSKMEVLDGDDIPLSNKSGVVERDIVQFVEFNKFKNNQEFLSEEVLREIPKQVEDYYRSNPLL